MPEVTAQERVRVNIVYKNAVNLSLKGVQQFSQGDEVFYTFGGFNLVKDSFAQMYYECQKKCGNAVTKKTFTSPKFLKTHVVYQILTSLKSSSIKSSFYSAEFGVFKGVTSMLITTILNNPEKHYIFDSFEGLSKPEEEDLEGSTNPVSGGEMSPSFEHIQNLFPTSIVQKCWIPNQLKHTDALFDFVHIDVDLYDPILGSLEYMIDKANPGCVIIVDDYNPRFPGCIQAIREHTSKHRDLYSLHYATGHGNYILIRK